MTARSSSTSPTGTRTSDAETPSGYQRTPRTVHEYRNNLLAAVGYLDLANSLDFAANVWNDPHPPTYAIVLMGVGGGIILLAISIAVWDLHRNIHNLRFLRAERRWMKEHAQQVKTGEERRTIAAWLAINQRELGWEFCDRMFLDLSMALSGLLVGVGTIMATRGDIPAVYDASNLLSGYIGNAFMPAYALINTAWSIYMWRCAALHRKALQKQQDALESAICKNLFARARKHQLYALLTAVTMWVTAVGSMMSATMWPGYVVLIPSIVGSIMSNWFWRHELGYDRSCCGDWLAQRGSSSILDQYEAVTLAHKLLFGGAEPTSGTASCAELGLREHYAALLMKIGLLQEYEQKLSSSQSYESDKAAALQEDYRSTALACLGERGSHSLAYQQRFLEELYGHWLCVSE